MTLVLENVSHCFGDTPVLRDVSLSVGAGEIVCLLGPSGCGKTTLLRIAAGLEPIQSGRVSIAGEAVADGGTGLDTAPERRGVGLLFQDYALFPHLTVAENIGFGLSALSASERSGRVATALEKVNMQGFAEAYPHVLSGGQQQRVALARVMAPGPRVILLDEPFSDLDARLRDKVRDDTLHMLQHSGISVLMVTHDPEEAMFMGERIALMQEGRIAQVGRPVDLYLSPVSSFVAGFLGEVNRYESLVESGRVMTPFGPVSARGCPEGASVEVLIRPEALYLTSGAEEGSARARVEAARMLGRTSLVHLSVADRNGGGPLHFHARLPGQFLPKEDELVSVTLDEFRTFVFPRL
ncbi:MAG: ABC transporter ATP-binding protein [Acetobacterales bacterium]